MTRRDGRIPLMIAAAGILLCILFSIRARASQRTEVSYVELGQKYSICPEFLEATFESDLANADLDREAETEKLYKLFEEYEDPDVVLVNYFGATESEYDDIDEILQTSHQLEVAHGK